MTPETTDTTNTIITTCNQKHINNTHLTSLQEGCIIFHIFKTMGTYDDHYICKQINSEDNIPQQPPPDGTL